MDLFGSVEQVRESPRRGRVWADLPRGKSAFVPRDAKQVQKRPALWGRR